MEKHIIRIRLNYFIAAVWIGNGLFCKALNLVPRHQQIVERILGSGHGRLITVLIGIAEMGMAVWILSGIRTRLSALAQMAGIAVMNILEFILAPDLLLWGRVNALFALLFIVLIYTNEFLLNKNQGRRQRVRIFKKSSICC